MPLNTDQEEFMALLKAAGWTKAEASRRLGISRASVTNILNGKNNPTRTLPLLRRVVAEFIGAKHSPVPVAVSTPKFRPSRLAPVISWASAGEASHNYHDVADQFQESVATDCPDPHCYTLIVEGDSMEPVFRHGDKIVVAPSYEAKNGNIVVARLSDTGAVLFKQLHYKGKDGSSVKLTSYNPDYPPIEFPKRAFRFIQPVYTMVRKVIF